MSCYPIYNDSFWNLPLIVVSEWKMCTRTFIERYCSQILESLKMQTKSNSASPLELVLVLPTRRKLNYTISKTVQQTAAAASVWSVQLACPCPSTSAGLFLSLAEQFEAQDPRGSREGTHSQEASFSSWNQSTQIKELKFLSSHVSSTFWDLPSAHLFLQHSRLSTRCPATEFGECSADGWVNNFNSTTDTMGPQGTHKVQWTDSTPLQLYNFYNSIQSHHRKYNRRNQSENIYPSLQHSGLSRTPQLRRVLIQPLLLLAKVCERICKECAYSTRG